MTNAEREQLRELAEWLNEESRKAAMNARLRIEDSITAILEAHSAKLAQWVTALDSAEKREKELTQENFILSSLYYKENAYAAEQFQRADSAEKRRKADFGIIFRSDESGEPLRQSDLDRLRIAELEAALSTERERVIEECARIAERSSWCGMFSCQEQTAAAIRALRSPKVAPKERK